MSWRCLLKVSYRVAPGVFDVFFKLSQEIKNNPRAKVKERDINVTRLFIYCIFVGAKILWMQVVECVNPGFKRPFKFCAIQDDTLNERNNSNHLTAFQFLCFRTNLEILKRTVAFSATPCNINNPTKYEFTK